jgi:hypothetical protein
MAENFQPQNGTTMTHDKVLLYVQNKKERRNKLGVINL